jgi:hypothetical protein
MKAQLTILSLVLLTLASSSAQQVQAPAPVAVAPRTTKNAPAPAPAKAVTTKAAAAPPPPVVYAPVRSFGQWVRDLPQDPILLVGFIVSLLSGLGFLFVIYTVVFELIMGIPFKRQSVLLGGSPINKASSVS